MPAPVGPNGPNHHHPSMQPEDSHVQQVAKSILGQTWEEHHASRELPVEVQSGKHLGIEVMTTFFEGHPLAGRRIHKESN